MRYQDCLAQHRTYIIAEMSGNHGGSLEKALEIVRAAAAAGADCLKTQTYTADTITIDAHTDAFCLGGGLWDRRYLYELYQEAYTPWEWMAPIKALAEELGMEFLSTPFDATAVEYLEGIGEEIYKVASFELVDIPLIRRIAQTGKPMILSCGMASVEEIQEALDTCRAAGNHNTTLLKCCSAYPTDYATMHLATITDMQARFGVPIGLSDHSTGTLADVAAVVLGAAVIEKHFCISREDNTVDSAFSLDKEEFAQMVRDVRNAELALGRGCGCTGNAVAGAGTGDVVAGAGAGDAVASAGDADGQALPAGVSYGPSPEEAQSYSLRRSLYATADIAAGEAFTLDNVRSIRPAGGLHTRYLDVLVGNAPDGTPGAKAPLHAARDIAFGTPLSAEDVAEGLQ